MAEHSASREEQIDRLAQLHYQSEATEAIYVCGEADVTRPDPEKLMAEHSKLIHGGCDDAKG